MFHRREEDEAFKDSPLSDFFDNNDGDTVDGFTVVDGSEYEVILKKNGKHYQVNRDGVDEPYGGTSYSYPDEAYEIERLRTVRVTYTWVPVTHKKQTTAKGE